MKIVIVDDDALIREGLEIILGTEEDFEVVGTAANGQDAFEICQKENPDIVLMDIRMPIMDGVQGTKQIKDHFKDIKVIILTTFKDEEYIYEAIKNGAEGYILKNQSSDSIIESIKAVMKGNIVLEKEVAHALSTMIREDKQKRQMTDNFSTREFEVLQSIAEGLSNREIAQKLFLSEGTVRNYITSLLEKLALRDRTQLAIYFLKHYE